MDKHGAFAAHKARVPWRIRLVFQGNNPDNVSGVSSKFWEAYQDAPDFTTGQVHVRWGKIGASGSSMVKTWEYVEDMLPEKLAKGYRYDSASKGPSVSAPTVARQPAPAPAPTPATLTGPFARIASLHPIRYGFEALDSAGNRLMTLTPDGARDLAQKHNIPIAGYFGG